MGADDNTQTQSHDVLTQEQAVRLVAEKHEKYIVEGKGSEFDPFEFDAEFAQKGPKRAIQAAVIGLVLNDATLISFRGEMIHFRIGDVRYGFEIGSPMLIITSILADLGLIDYSAAGVAKQIYAKIFSAQQGTLSDEWL